MLNEAGKVTARDTVHRARGHLYSMHQLIGGAEADTANIAGEPIGILLDQRNGVGAIGLVDADRPRRADAMALQKHHDLTDDLLVGPAGRDAVEPDLADAFNLQETVRRGLDHIEHRLAEGGNQALGEMRANPLDQAGGQIALDALAR